MTLDKHKLQGIPPIRQKTLPPSEFESLLAQAGYTYLGSGSAQMGRFKLWWGHPSYPRIEAIYSSDKQRVITAYHPSAD
jgi:hypothetical protein